MGNFNFIIPDDLHKKFKKHSIDKGKDMREIILDFIKKEVA